MSLDQKDKTLGEPKAPVPHPVKSTIESPQIPTMKATCHLCNRMSDGSILYHMVNRHMNSLTRAVVKYGTIDAEVFKNKAGTFNFPPNTEEFHFMKEFIESNSTPYRDMLPTLKKHQRLGDTHIAQECDARQEQYIPSDAYRPIWEEQQRLKKERGEIT